MKKKPVPSSRADLLPSEQKEVAWQFPDDREEMGDEQGGSGEIQALSIAVKILEILATERKELKAASIARDLAMTPPRTWRHLRTMQSLGLVEQSEGTGAFRLGWRLVQLGQSAASQYSVTDVAHPYLVELRDQLNLTTYMTLPYRDGAVVAQCIPGGTQLSIMLHPGTFFPFHAGASSRVLLAFSSAERQAQVLSGPLPADSEPDPITTQSKLKTRLESIRKRFYDMAVNSSPYRLTGISAPVFDHNNDVVATVGLLSGLKNPDDDSVADQAKLVCVCARRVSNALGSTRWQQADAER